MRKGDLLEAAYRLNARFKHTRLARVPAVRRAKRAAGQLVLRLQPGDEIVLGDVSGQMMYVRREFYRDYMDRPYEPKSTELFTAALKPGATVVDVGAHMGFFTLLAAQRVGPGGKVFAFEPAPENFEVLSLNLAMHGLENVDAVRKAVGDKNETVYLRLTSSSALHSLHHHPLSETTATIPVECVTLDGYLGGRPVDVVKIDVEGHEPWVLEGMRETIARSPGMVMLCEASPACLREAGVEAEDFLSQLIGLGFEVQLIDDVSCTVTPVEQGHLLEVFERLFWPTNFICTKRQ